MDCNHHGYPQWRGLLSIVRSEIMVWLNHQVTTPTASSLARKLSWQWLQGFDFEILFSSRTFNDSCAGRCSLWSNVREKCAFAVKIKLRTHKDRQGITSNGLVADPFSISCYVMPIRVFCLWWIRSVQVLLTYSGSCGIAHAFNSLARVVNAHAVTPHCIPQIMLATFEVRKYFWVVSLVTRALALTIREISVVWFDSHLPSASSDFYAADFVLSISQFRAVQFQFRSPGLGFFLSS